MQYSTVPPWLLSTGKPLIDAVTGAPGRAFPLRGSERQGYGCLSPLVAASLGILPTRVSSSLPLAEI